MSIRIYIVDDELMAIQYFKRLVQETELDCTIVGQNTTGVKAIPEILALRPDIVFADVSMPMMDGLQMSQEILKKNPMQKIIVLTSYKSFEFVQTSIQLGITDYILKNDLNKGSLSMLLEKVADMLEKEKEEQNLILRHNFQLFLLSQDDASEYPNIEKKTARMVLISFIKQQKIRLKYSKQEESGVNLDCFRLEQLDYFKGIECRAVVRMEANEYVGIFSMDESVQDEAYAMKKVLNILQPAVELQEPVNFTYFVSEPTYNVLNLPIVYHTIRKLQDYVYSFTDKTIFSQKEWQHTVDETIVFDQYREVFREQLEEEDLDSAKDSLFQIFEVTKKHCNIWEYTEEMRTLLHYIADFAERKKIDSDIEERSYSFEDTEETEEMLCTYLNRVFEALNQQKEQQYTRYIQQAIEFIQKNYAQNIAIPDIAEAVNISEGHLRKCFKQETNMKVIDYLTDYRLEKAKKYIEKGEHHLDTVWKKTGFTSAQYFSYVFKKREGMSPRDYMKKKI